MGNCFGSKSVVVSEPPTASASGTATATDFAPPPKKQRKEQPFVTIQVELLRSQASNYHEKVVLCAKASQEAWQKDEKGGAHTLSEEKKNWQKKKDDANQRAAKLILEPQKWQASREIDLHGLYLDEAMDATREFLRYWSKKTLSRETVLIITGAGHHSDNKKAVIRPKVEELLQNQGLEYDSVHGNGAFRVILRAIQ